MITNYALNVNEDSRAQSLGRCNAATLQLAEENSMNKDLQTNKTMRK